MSKTIQKLTIGLSTTAAALASFAVLVYAATTVVSPANMQGWAFAQETPVGSGQMENGPGPSTPMGSGSAELVVNDTGGEILYKEDYKGLKLSDITQLQYSTYRTSGGDALAIALQFNIDSDVTDLNEAYQGRLVYEPYYTAGVATGVWQTWVPSNDAGDGNWWLSNATLAASSGCTMANPCNFSEVKAAFPNAGIHNTFGAVIFKAGGGWLGGFEGNVDAFTINSDTYDFELVGPTPSPTITPSPTPLPSVVPTATPRPVPTDKDQCKNSGWRNYVDSNGQPFRNQGQCVSFTNHS